MNTHRFPCVRSQAVRAWLGGMVLLVGLVPYVQAQTPVVLTDSVGQYLLDRHLAILRDAEHRSFDEIRAADQAGAFAAVQGRPLRFSYDEAAYWARFTVIDSSSSAVSLWLLEVGENSLDQVDVYVPGAGGEYAVQVSGDGRPFSERLVQDRHLIFPLLTHPGEAQRIYVRVASAGPISLPLTVWSGEAYNGRVQGEQLLLGVFFGSLLIIALYNLLLYVSLRDIAFLYYVLYLFAFLAHELAVERYAFEFVWPNALWWHARANSVLALLCGVFGMLFARSYLQLPVYAPLIDRILLGLIGASGLIGVVLLATISPLINRLVVLFMLVVAVTTFVGGVRSWQGGYRAARYYLLAWGILLGSVVIGLLGGYLGLLPGNTWIVARIGAMLNAVLLSLGLGYRFHQLRLEREQLRISIAQDLHDDVGALLTQVASSSSFIVQLARRQDRDGAEIESWAQRSGELARLVMDRMRDIVWAIKPQEEALDEVIAHMREAAQRLLAGTDIAFDMQGTVDSGVPVPSLEVRHNVTLMVKEILHNAVKHAACTRIEVRYHAEGNRLTLKVADDGQGFDPETVERGNGLDNLHRRAAKIDAALHLDTGPGGPTRYRIETALVNAGRVA